MSHDHAKELRINESQPKPTPLADVEEDKNSVGAGQNSPPHLEGVLAAATDGQTSLLPCPFCSGKPKLFATRMQEEGLHPVEWSIGCTNLGCGCGLHYYWGDKAQLIQHWNTRSDASGYVRGLEDAAKVAQSWANSPSCTQPHEDDPCCHRRTGAGIFDAIQVLISQHEKSNA